jgi:PAS domain S-box-containing protein
MNSSRSSRTASRILIRMDVRCFLAVTAAAAAILLRSVLEHILGAKLPPFIFSGPLIMGMALWAGFWPGLAATAITILLTLYVPLGSEKALAIAGAPSAAPASVTALMGVLICWLAERYRRYRQTLAVLATERAVNQTEEQFRFLANAMPQLCWMANADGWIYWYNQRWYDYTGTTPEQMKGWGWQSVHDPKALPEVMERWKASIATGTPFEMVFPLRGAGGAFRPFLTRGVPTKDAEGKIVHWFGTNTDISEQQKAADALRESEERYRKLFDEPLTAPRRSGLPKSTRYFIGVALLVLAVNAVTAYRSVSHLIGNHRSVSHTYEVIGQLQQLISVLKDAETGNRGYVLTRADEYLEPYNTAMVSLGPQLASLKELTADDPRQQKRLPVLEQDIGERMALLQQGIDFRRKGEPGRAQRELQDAGQRKMDEIRAIVDSMLDDESSVLAALDLDSGRSARSSVFTLVLAAVLSVVFLLWVALLLKRKQHLLDTTAEAGERFRTIFDQASVGITQVGLDGCLLSANPGLTRMFGYREDEMVGKSFLEFTHPDDREREQREIGLLERGERGSIKLEARYLRHDGTTASAILNSSVVKGQDGNPLYRISVLQDVEPLRQAEQVLAEKARLLELSNDAIFVRDRHDRITYWNHGAAQVYGYTPEEALGRAPRELLKTEFPQVPETILDEVRKTGRWSGELVHTCKDGRRVVASTRFAAERDEEGNIGTLLATCSDITAQRAQERILAEKARLLELSNDAIFVRGGDKRISYWNHGAVETYGYSREEALGRDPEELLKTVFSQPLESVLNEVRQSGRWSGELVHTRKGGARVVVSARWAVDFDAEGGIAAILETSSDITQRKRAEAALRESQDLLRLFVEHAPAALAMFDREMRYLHWSRRWAEDYHLPTRDVRGQSHYVLFPEISEEWKEVHRRGLAGEVVSEEADRFERADGSVQWIRWEVHPWRDFRGEVGGIVIFADDITQRMQTEQALRQSEERLSAVMANLTEGLVVADDQGQMIHWNPAALGMHGYANMDECRRRLTDFPDTFELQSLDGDLLLPVAEWPMSRVLNGEQLRDFAVRLRRLDQGWEKIVLFNGSLIRSAGGETLAFLSITDITERKQAEAQIARLASFPELNPGFIFETDLEGSITYLNPSIRSRFPTLEKDGLKHPLLRDWFSAAASFQAGDAQVIEREVETGGLVLFQLLNSPQPGVIRAYCFNITERKQAEEALRESEDRMRLFIERAPAALAMFDREMRYIHWSKRWAEDYHVTGRDLRGQSTYDIFPETPEKWRQAHRRGLAGEVVSAEEERFERADGSTQWVRWEVRPWRDFRGDIGGILVFAEEITQRVLAEQALRASEEKFRALIEQASDAFMLHDDEGRFLEVNHEACESLGYTREELLGMHVYDVREAVGENGTKKLWENAEPGRAYTLQTAHRRKDGTTFPVEARLSPFLIGGQRLHLGLIRDITERIQAQRKMNDDRERMDLALGVAQAAEWEVDLVTGKAFQSERHAKLFGYSAPRDDWSVDSFLEHVAAEDRSTAREKLQECVSTGNMEYEVRVRRADGQLRWFWLAAHCRNDESGKPSRIFGVVMDISEHKFAEEALRQSLERLERVMEIETVGIMFWDMNTGHMVDANDTFLKMTGYDRSDVGERRLTWQKLTPPEHMDVSRREIEKFMTTGRIGPYEKEYFCKDGSKRWLLLAGSSLGSNQCVQFCVDIADRVKAEQALRESEERLSLTIQASSIGTWDLNIESGQLGWSERCLAIFGIPPGTEMSSERFLEAIHPGDRGRTEEAVRTALDKHEEHDVEMRTVWPDGTLHWVGVRGRAFYGKAGQPLSMRGVAIDITDRKIAQLELQKLNEELEDRVRQRTSELETMNKEASAFSYSVSHDLRAPLRTMAGFSQALLEDHAERMDERGLHYLTRIQAAAQRMGDLIDALLSLSRLTRAEMEIKPADLSAIAQAVVSGLRDSDRSRKVEVKIEPGLCARGDQRLLQVALQNLISNAWKFTLHSERPTIEVGRLNDRPSPVYFVRDNGAGFDMQYANQLFAPFQRLHTEAEFAGTGIGLATVQRVILRHHGRIWAEAAEGKGATFFFELGV